MSLVHLRDDERQDLETEIRRLGLSIADFELTDTPERLVGPGPIAPVVGSVTIKSKRTRAQRTYQTGHGSSWIADFASDLASGVL